MENNIKNNLDLTNFNKLINNSINVNNIKNKNIYNGLIDELICLVCLNIPIEPIQCSKCDIVLCKDCLEILNLSQKNCLSPECQELNCSSKKLYFKATKFVKEILEQLVINCDFCHLEDINYSKYKIHLEEKCESYKKIENKREEFIKTYKGLIEREEKLKSEIETAIFKRVSLIEKEDPPEDIAQIRASLITNILGQQEKKIFHEVISEGNIDLFKSFILQKKYPIFEEISAKGYFWTSIHYAMHYGKWSIIEFCLKYLKEKGLFEKGMKLKSNDNRCPILCLLKSNSLKNEEKKDIFERIIKEFDIRITPDINKEINARNIGDILQKYHK